MASESPYQTVIPLVGSLPSWVTDTRDQERLASYDVYDDMYNNNPDSYALMLRGLDDQPIQMPTAKSIIKNLSRYVGRGFGYAVAKDKGTESEQVLAIQMYGDLFKRENMLSKFRSGVRQCLRRGDAFWYISGDTTKDVGSKISINMLDPRTVFKITHPEDIKRVIGYDVVEQFQDGDKLAVKKQSWLKNTHPEHPNFGQPLAPVFYECITIEADGWDGDDPKIMQTIVPLGPLPTEIVQLPIYHWKNDGEDDQEYGSSELRSLERVIAAINQSVSDEDIALAMAGLGMYKSSSGGPVSDNGEAGSDWIIGPGRVIEDATFERVDGISTVKPSLDHIDYLEKSIDATVGITDVSRGVVDAATAESGVALAIRMSPTIDMADEKDVHIKDVFDKLLYDLKAWFIAFEGVNLINTEVTTAFGDKMPRNRDAEMGELMSLFEAKIISVEFFHSMLTTKFGYELPTNIMDQIAADAARNAPADPYGDFNQDAPGAAPGATDEEV